MPVTAEVERSLTAKFAALLPHLDERTQRLYLGSEARSLGHGGISAVARAAGVSRQTVSAGVDELESGSVPMRRVRRSGGGRKRAAEVDPGLRPALWALMEPDVHGDQISPLRWTAKSTRTLAAELTRQGHPVSADTVGDLLRAAGFSLQANAKNIEGARHPDRDGQFRYINEQVKTYQAAGDPVVSVNTKKRELVGQHTNAGRRWRRGGEPVAVATHDFPDKDPGKAIPYGICDPAANTDWMGVRTDHDTAAFAVACLRRWWETVGRDSYPYSHRMLVTADAEGSNGYRTRAWTTELSAFAVDSELEITVCHLPPGTSKWNAIEHRLFSHITMNWPGRPLESHEVIVNSIAATATRTGPIVHAEPDTDTYDTGVRVSDARMDALPPDGHDWHGEWNYTLRPQPYSPGPITASDPFDQPGPDLTWLAHPVITGLSPPEWDTLITTLTSLHDQQREAHLERRRGHRPRQPGSGAGRRPVLTLAERLLATVLHDRLGLPQVAIAALFSVRPETINKRIHDIHQLLSQTGRTIDPASQRLTALDDLYDLARAAGITIPDSATSAS